MAITKVQTQTSSGISGSSVSLTFGSSTSAGNTLVAFIAPPFGLTVASITDTAGNRWMQVGAPSTYQNSSTVNTLNLWYAIGISGGADTVTVTFNSSASAVCDINISEFSGVSATNPLDQWCTTGQSSPSGTSFPVGTLQPHVAGELMIAAGLTSTGGTTLTPPSGYSASIFSNTYFNVSYFVNSGTTPSNQTWTTSASVGSFAALGLSLIPGPAQVNPKLRFPETLVQVCNTTNWEAILQGSAATWTNISRYVQKFTVGPLGRNHELGRIQSTPAQIDVDARDGTFNTWNTSSSLYNSSASLVMPSMTPIQITAAWNGVTSPVYYGYTQSVTTSISDVLNTNATIRCQDLLQILSLKNGSNDNLAQQIFADGGANLAAYYRLNSQDDDYDVEDSSGNGLTGSLVSGLNGSPAYGADPVCLYDTATSLDLTNGTNSPNGGFYLLDTRVQPPSYKRPFSGYTGSVTLQCWFRNTSSYFPNSTGVPNGVLMSWPTSNLQLQTGLLGSLNVTNLGTGTTVGLVNSNNETQCSPSQQMINVYDGYWHQVTLVMWCGASVGAPSPTLYIDGKKQTVYVQDTSASARPWINNTDVPYFGVPGANGNGGYWATASAYPAQGFTGLLSDVALYKGALTTAQIRNQYTIGSWFREADYAARNGDASYGRLNQLLTVVGLDPTTVLNVPYDFQTQVFGEVQSVATTSALNYMQTLADTEPGIIFQSPDGFIQAYNREYYYLNSTSTTSQATIADSPAATYHYEGVSLKITGDDLDTWNDVTVSSARPNAKKQTWGPSQSTAASVSAALYGPRTLQGQTSLKQQYDVDALATAQNYIKWYVNTINRVQQVTLKSQSADGNNLNIMLPLGLWDRITVTYAGQTPGTTFSQDSLIEGISHTVDLQGPTWSTTWNLSPYELAMKPTILDTYVFGGGSGAVLTL
jgi:hypothetical protein